MWKGHILEVHCTNIQRKGSLSNEIFTLIIKFLKYYWINGSERTSEKHTAHCLQGIKGTIMR